MSPTFPGVDVPDPALQKATRLGLVVDQNRCVGCWSCSVACKEEQNVPIGMYWLRVLTVGGDAMDVPAGTFPDLKMAYQPTQLLSVRQPALRQGLPHAGDLQDVERHRQRGLRALHRLSLLHGGLPLRQPRLQLAQARAGAAGRRRGRRRDAGAVQGRRREVHLLRAAHRQGPAAALRHRLPGRRPLLRRPRRPEQHRVGAAARPALVCRVPRTRHASPACTISCRTGPNATGGAL